MWILKEWSSNHKPPHFGWMHREVICIHYELIVPFVIIFIWFICASARSVTLGQTACVKIVSWIRFKQKPGRRICALSEILISKTNKTSLSRPNPKSSVVEQISAYNHLSFEMWVNEVVKFTQVLVARSLFDSFDSVSDWLIKAVAVVVLPLSDVTD